MPASDKPDEQEDAKVELTFAHYRGAPEETVRYAQRWDDIALDWEWGPYRTEAAARKAFR